MGLPVDREFITQSAIALGACLGGWMFFVQPKAEELHTLETSLRQLRSRPTVMSHDSFEQIAKLAPKLRERSNEIAARGAVAEDTSQLYGRIMNLAKEHDVQVKNLRPGDHKAGKEKTVTVTRIDMTAEGEYERIAEFFEALDGIGAYLRTASVQIAPTKRAGGSYTVMQLGFEVLQFRLPKMVVEMARRGNDHS
jgi:Tfp pilus assembly protein PilO